MVACATDLTPKTRFALRLRHQAKQSPSKNRVWNFFETSSECVGIFTSQPVDSHQETRDTTTKTVSGRANGNITDYVNTNGAVVAHREFDAYGNTLVAIGAMVNDFHFWFSSKYLDQETGLYYYGYRYYSPELGRWPSRDPIGEVGGLNQYGFLGNYPVSAIDPLGAEGFVLPTPPNELPLPTPPPTIEPLAPCFDDMDVTSSSILQPSVPDPRPHRTPRYYQDDKCCHKGESSDSPSSVQGSMSSDARFRADGVIEYTWRGDKWCYIRICNYELKGVCTGHRIAKMTYDLQSATEFWILCKDLGSLPSPPSPIVPGVPSR
jgi:RHS repeat-associated protein